MSATKKPVKKIKKTKPTKASAKPLKKSSKKKLKTIASLASGVDIVEKADGTYAITGKNAKGLEGAVVERRERQYKFDDRLVPYYVGSDTKEGNIALRDALINLGKTAEMTELFLAIKNGNLEYTEGGENTFVKSLVAIIKGHDQRGLVNVFEDDIVAIHENNLKVFNDFWDAREKPPGKDNEFEGFSN